jgi:hypothetical protein
MVLLVLAGAPTLAQRPRLAPRIKATEIVGPKYSVPETKVYLTDEATGMPYADMDVVVKYYWTWKVLKRTSATDQMGNIREVGFSAHADKNGVVIIPSRTITPKRPPAPRGSEFSLPEFMSMTIDVYDSTHNCRLMIYDPHVDLSDGPGEVRRTVMLYPRPKN